MKKKIMGIITLLITSIFIGIQPVLAQTIDAKLNTNVTELKANESVEITLSLDNFHDIKKGINAIIGTLEYDKSIFEEIVQSDFACQNNWEELKFNPQNGEIVAIRKVGTLVGENVVTITLKVKNNVASAKTLIKVTNLTTSEGKKDIYLKDAEVALNIIKEQEVIPSTPNIPNKPNNSGTHTNNPNAPNIDDGNTSNPDMNPINPGDTNNTNPDLNNNDSENKNNNKNS